LENIFFLSIKIFCVESIHDPASFNIRANFIISQIPNLVSEEENVMKKNTTKGPTNEMEKLVTHQAHVEENPQVMDKRRCWRSPRIRSTHKMWECYSRGGR